MGERPDNAMLPNGFTALPPSRPKFHAVSMADSVKVFGAGRRPAVRSKHEGADAQVLPNGLPYLIPKVVKRAPRVLQERDLDDALSGLAALDVATGPDGTSIATREDASSESDADDLSDDERYGALPTVLPR